MGGTRRRRSGRESGELPSPGSGTEAAWRQGELPHPWLSFQLLLGKILRRKVCMLEEFRTTL
jgi:hypothetical protein